MEIEKIQCFIKKKCKEKYIVTWTKVKRQWGAKQEIKQKERNQLTDRAMLHLFEGILNEFQLKR